MLRAELSPDFARKAMEVSDCGSAKQGGDLDVLEPGEMMAEFEAAASVLKVGELSDIVESESGLHIILRTPLVKEALPSAPSQSRQRRGSVQGAKAAASVQGPYRAMQILIKHVGSARQASWRDPDGIQIKARTKDAAMVILKGLRENLERLSFRACHQQTADAVLCLRTCVWECHSFASAISASRT